MASREWFAILATDAKGVSISKVQKSGSGFSPGRFAKGKPGRSNISSSSGVALNGAMSTPAALMLQSGMRGRCQRDVANIKKADLLT